MTFPLELLSELLAEVCLDVFEAFCVLRFGAHGNAEHVTHGGLRTDDGALRLQELEGVHRVLESADGDEVRVAIDVGEAQFLEACLELFKTLLVELADFVHVFLVVDGADGGGLGDAVHVERFTHAVDEVHDFGAGDAVTHAEAREAVNLAERTAADDVPAFGDAAVEIRDEFRRVFDKFGVGFVHHEHAGFREAVSEVEDFLGGEVRAGRIVRVREEHDAGLFVHGGTHGLEVVIVGRGGHIDFDQLGVHGHGGEFVNSEAVLAHHGFHAGAEEHLGNHVQELVAAVTDGNLFALHAAELCNLSDEVVAAAIRVEVHFFQRLAGLFHALRAWAKRVFVARELVDVFRVEAEFAGGVGDGLAGHVERLVQDVLLCEFVNVHRYILFLFFAKYSSFAINRLACFY